MPVRSYRSSHGAARWQALIATVATGLLLASCAPRSPDDPLTEGADDEQADAGSSAAGGDLSEDEIVIAMLHPHTSLESWWAYSELQGVVIRNVQEPLVDRAQDDAGEIVPALAEEWERLDDTTIRFELREGVTYHDGTEFDAEAAAQAVNFLFDEANGFALRSFMGPQITAEAVDELTLDVSTDGPDPILEKRLVFAVLPSPSQFEDDLDAWASEPVGTGPYEFVSWDRGEQIVVERNDDWWGGADELTFERAVFLERPDGQSRLTAVQAGDAHLGEWAPVDACMDTLGDGCITASSNHIVWIRPDAVSHPALEDQRVREAMALAIDVEGIANGLYAGAELAPQLTVPATIGFNDELQPYPFDPEGAERLLGEAAADGVPVDDELLLLLDRGRIPHAEDLGQVVQDQLNAVGFNVDLRLQDDAEYSEWYSGEVPDGRNHLALHQHTERAFDYSITAPVFIACDGPVSSYCNPDLGALHDEGVAASGDERDELYRELAAAHHEDVAYIPFFYPLQAHAAAADLQWEPRDDMVMYLKEMSIGR